MRGQKDLRSVKKGSIGLKIKLKCDTKGLKTILKVIHFGEKLD